MISIDPDAPAFLIWLPEGAVASAKDFHVTQSWTLEQAAKQAYEASKDHSKRPWIMTDGRILDENGIARVMSGLRATRRIDRA